MKKNVFPAIDLIDGRCVRLLQGEYSNEIEYNDDPISQAVSFQEEGASWIHIVDLDAARTGIANNASVIENIVSRLEIPVQVGGGIRNLEAARSVFDLGVTRIVIGTAAIDNPSLVEEATSIGRVAVGIDLRNEKVAVHGWKTETVLSYSDLFERFEEVDVDAYIVTHIERDGTLEGPDIDAYKELISSTTKDVIASGGVGSTNDLRNLSELSANGRTLRGVIVGRAFYEDKFSLSEAIEAFETV
ncbi:MAG: 1-(5-phosphoribosyl)-5-[(5-phosphoribosylamino)methylideneamino]imidazole-4-carboxamide isomerase [Acidimicrobiales bacterium]|jgi:phosphoribosylformimino-5-aminoimidazole carboxamide ribotide isomerase|nr:1-(5-phosphoribosyl)-5-[(5-phosphoribosylamino)methylideneamino]imidazole-4-carboxamide isomerase [Acidimicrobiaceae bacterium]MDP6161861.1 1-(5-phosphoribosyl)-5-[(5-phosphoribosylamino)methylideneamino]imidazole-4-carboxamide isomerase [Acidimicrobiales bacterium]MDP6284771.1 1-(5-phosphoribosyl)-5-[(5-phosphoribosylamino)methylideneamino]imidazole-4-carboxamide isomerase [Acidimicrobiales bacterium]HJL91142.1 1-(5-phosphoribosyl)-5-[(5-phosphoribosylamino)methylideneamino]imidazole-4-carbo|tara:strand:- start:3168 stop:3902 length:735 start_codon:yes stop_codon:yes gene_type:complete